MGCALSSTARRQNISFAENEVQTPCIFPTEIASGAKKVKNVSPNGKPPIGVAPATVKVQQCSVAINYKHTSNGTGEDEIVEGIQNVQETSSPGGSKLSVRKMPTAIKRGQPTG